jgi:hypothetical protein
VQAMAFPNMTNKVSVTRLDFSQNLSEISNLFGANCQSLIFNFLTYIRRVTNTYKATKCLFSGKKKQKFFSFPTHKQERITMTEKYQKFPVPSKHHV